jgi:hypothetical protein
MNSPIMLQVFASLSLPFVVATVNFAQTGTPPHPPAAVSSYGNLPLLFEANQGQTDPSVQFLSHGQGYTLFLRQGEAVLALRSAAPSQNKAQNQVSQSDLSRPGISTVRMELVGANSQAEVVHEDEQITKANYFFGKDPNQWHTGISNYGRVRYRSIYEGIDQVYYGNQRRLEHDFVIAPNADPGQIILALQGAKDLRIDAATGDLVVDTGQGDLHLQKPIAYQEEPNRPRTAIPSSYKLLAKNRISFTLGSYDRSRPLVIDPVLTYSTYLGGSGNNGNGDQGNGIVVDASGNAYIVGTAYSTDFPATTGAYQKQDKAASGNSTIFVSELNAAGTALIYSTYLGGSGGDFGYGIALDSNNNAYITGATYSTDFPVTCNAYQTANPTTSIGATTAFVARLTFDGSALLYSSYLGGTGNQSSPALGDIAQAIAVDAAGDAYVTGYTYSSDFPVSDSAFQATYAGTATTSNAFVTKLNPGGTSLLYSTYLGGSGTPAYGNGVPATGDYGNAIALDSSGDAFIAGTTGSTNFPVTGAAFQATLAGLSNAFVTELNPAGSAEVYSTYLGGSGQQYDVSDDFNPPPPTGDTASAIAVDAGGNAYVAGTTTSSNFPVTAGVLEGAAAFDSSSGFVTKLNANGSALVYSTYVEGTGTTISGLAVDSSGSAYVTGAAPAASAGVPGGFQATTDALPAPSSTGNLAFLVKLDPGATVLNYATLLGGSSNDGGNALALDGTGNVYLTGFTTSADFPATAGAFQAKFGQPSSTPIPTTLSVISQQFFCSTQFPGFSADVNLLISSNSTGPAPTGSLNFYGDFEVGEYGEPVTPGPGGTATVDAIGTSSLAVQQSASWEADYSGDSVYAPSSLTGTATGPGNCDSQPYVRRERDQSGQVQSEPKAHIPAAMPQMNSHTGQRKATRASSLISTDVVRGADQVGISNAFVSKLALAGESNQTTYPALPTGISTTLTAGASSISLYCDPDGTVANAFNFTTSAILNTASSGPPPTGTIIFTDSFNYSYPLPYQIQFVDSWNSGPLTFSFFDGENMDGPIGPFDVSWTASYYGDAVYGYSTVSGTTSSTGCPAPSGSVTKSEPKGKTPRIEVHSSTGQRIGGASLPTPAANSTLPATTLVVAGSHAAKFIPALMSQNGETQDARRASSQETPACVAPVQTATPVLSAVGGTYNSPQSVTITDATPGAIIYYTIDGTAPTVSSTVYAGAINVSSTETLQAIAVAGGYSASAVASVTLTIILPTASAPTFSPIAGAYTSPQSVTIADTTPGASIHYTTDGTTPTAASTVFSTAIPVSSNQTIQAIAIATGYVNSAVSSATYTITPPAAAPTFSPAAGTYTSVQSVAIADSTPGAAIYYTTDGSTPSASSTPYTAAISVGVTETIQAIAIAPGYSSSPVASAAYTINLPPPTFTLSTSVSSLTIQPGQSGTVTISVTPQNSFTGATTFSCTGLPAGATCTFAPPSVTPSGGVATTTLTVSASSTANLQRDHAPFSGKLPGATLALALCCIGWRKRRSAKLLLLALAIISAGATLLSGCGGSSKPKPVTSTVSVVATSGAVQQTVPLSITIE